MTTGKESNSSKKSKPAEKKKTETTACKNYGCYAGRCGCQDFKGMLGEKTPEELYGSDEAQNT
jgi:hypothetical protein